MLPRIFCLVSDADDRSVLVDLVTAGISGFQVRDKALSGRDLLTLTGSIIDAVRPLGGVVVVNDRLDVALAAGADGVHLGADDLGVRAARRVAPELIIGATCRDRAQVEQARADGADYAGFGPLFATTSKTALPPAQGVGSLASAVGVLPLLGIGGVSVDNARSVMDAGAHGVAVIGAVWQAFDPMVAARALVAATS